MLYVVRHGQTDMNKEGRLQGKKGISLNENGIAQAKKLRGKLEGAVPDPGYYKGVEGEGAFIKRIFGFMNELEKKYRNANVLLSGHRCTTGAIGAYFQGIPKDGNIL